MRSFFRNVAAMVASVSLVFFWSCERHEVGELPDHQHHGKDDHGKGTMHSHAGDHKDGHKHDDKAGHADDKPNPADGGMAQEGTGTPGPGQGPHKHDTGLSNQALPPVGTPAMPPAGTPAQFFPSPSPR
jgi:hypothetical protein